MIAKLWPISLILIEQEGSDEIVKCGQCYNEKVGL